MPSDQRSWIKLRHDKVKGKQRYEEEAHEKAGLYLLDACCGGEIAMFP